MERGVLGFSPFIAQMVKWPGWTSAIEDARENSNFFKRDVQF